MDFLTSIEEPIKTNVHQSTVPEKPSKPTEINSSPNTLPIYILPPLFAAAEKSPSLHIDTSNHSHMYKWDSSVNQYSDFSTSSSPLSYTSKIRNRHYSVGSYYDNKTTTVALHSNNTLYILGSAPASPLSRTSTTSSDSHYHSPVSYGNLTLNALRRVNPFLDTHYEYKRSSSLNRADQYQTMPVSNFSQKKMNFLSSIFSLLRLNQHQLFLNRYLHHRQFIKIQQHFRNMKYRNIFRHHLISKKNHHLYVRKQVEDAHVQYPKKMNQRKMFIKKSIAHPQMMIEQQHLILIYNSFVELSNVFLIFMLNQLTQVVFMKKSLKIIKMVMNPYHHRVVQRHYQKKLINIQPLKLFNVFTILKHHPIPKRNPLKNKLLISMIFHLVITLQHQINYMHVRIEPILRKTESV